MVIYALPNLLRPPKFTPSRPILTFSRHSWQHIGLDFAAHKLNK